MFRNRISNPKKAMRGESPSGKPTAMAQTVEQLETTVREALGTAGQYIVAHPVACLVAAAAAGIALGWLVKRT